MQQVMTTFCRRSGLAALLMSLVAAAAPAAAAPITFSRAAFDAAFPGSVRETWNGFPVGTIFADGTTANGITYNTTSGDPGDAIVSSIFSVSDGTRSLGRKNNTGGIFAESFFGGDVLTFTFASPLTAFGLELKKFGADQGPFTATTNQGEVIQSVVDPSPFVQFIGFSTNSAFTSISIIPGDGIWNVDNLRAVPEPATLFLLGSGLAVAVLRRRKSLKTAPPEP